MISFCSTVPRSYTRCTITLPLPFQVCYHRITCSLSTLCCLSVTRLSDQLLFATSRLQTHPLTLTLYSFCCSTFFASNKIRHTSTSWWKLFLTLQEHKLDLPIDSRFTVERLFFLLLLKRKEEERKSMSTVSRTVCLNQEENSVALLPSLGKADTRDGCKSILLGCWLVLSVSLSLSVFTAKLF